METTKITQSIKELHDLTARLDERVQDLQTDVTTLLATVKDTEIKLVRVEMEREQSQSKWTRIVDSTWRLGITIVAAWVLWKLGLPIL